MTACAFLAAGPLRADPPRSLTVCTQNLWNYGLPEAVKRLRRPEARLETLRAALARQEAALAARLSPCDIIAVQELVGEEDEARRALERLARRLTETTGHPYAARAADTRDVIRNGFLFREDRGLREVDFQGHHSHDRLPSLRGFPRGSWDRGPAELVVEVKTAQAIDAATGTTRVRIIGSHLKSKIERERSIDPSGERWERLRVLQARALLNLVNRRLEENPEELVLVAGDFNNGRGSATRAVMTGQIEPFSLLSPRDCISSEGEIACDLPLRAPVLIDLADGDPDLRGRGSYRFDGREELIDGIFASPAAARLAREPGGAPDDYDILLAGGIFAGSDHRLVRVTLRF